MAESRIYFTPEQVEEFWPGEDPAEINRQADALLAEIKVRNVDRALSRAEQWISADRPLLEPSRINLTQLRADLALIVPLAREKWKESV